MLDIEKGVLKEINFQLRTERLSYLGLLGGWGVRQNEETEICEVLG